MHKTSPLLDSSRDVLMVWFVVSATRWDLPAVIAPVG